MSSAGIQYKIGGDASALGNAFQHALRFTGDFTDRLKRALSARGLFDGLASGLVNALGGQNLGDVLGKAFKDISTKEIVQQQFKGLLGDGGDVARTVISELKSVATDAGVAHAEMLGVAAKMVGPGGSGMMNGTRAIETLKMLTDVARGGGPALAETGEIFGKMFESGKADAMALRGLKQIGIYEALAGAMKMDREEVEKLGETGKLTYDNMDAALRRLTGEGGKYFEQANRYKNTLDGIGEASKEAFGKVPGAFLQGLLAGGDGMEVMKIRMRQIRDAMMGWVGAARDFGKAMGENVRAVTLLMQGGTTGWSAIGDGIQAGLVGALNVLVRGLSAAADGFIAAMLQGMAEAKDALWGKTKPGADVRIRDSFTNAVKEGWKNGGKKGGDMIANPAADRWENAMRDAKGMAAWGLTPGGTLSLPGMSLQIADFVAAKLKGADGGNDYLSPANKSREREEPVHMKYTAPDDYARIGLYVGGGGPQGEAIAKQTADNTKIAADELKEIKGILRLDPKGQITFRGGRS